MTNLSTPPPGKQRSRVIALWKDAKDAGSQELELPANSEALALTLTVHYDTEFTADGRSDMGTAAFPVLSGVHPIKLNEQRTIERADPIEWISPQDAATLARLAEYLHHQTQLGSKLSENRPSILEELRGSAAKRIGQEMWCIKADNPTKTGQDDYFNPGSPGELETARLICKWAETNRQQPRTKPLSPPSRFAQINQ